MSWFDEVKRAVRGDVNYDERHLANPPDLRSAAANQFVQWHIGKPMWPEADIRTFERDGYRRSALVFRCVQYLSNAAGSAPLGLFFEDEEGEPQEVKDHPLRDLMRQPNLGQGEAQFLSFVTMTAVIAGYAVIEKERDQANRVIGLWVMRPDWLKAIRQPKGRIDWEYTVPGHDPIIKKHEDVVHLTYADTLDGRPTGIGPLEIMLREIGIANALTDFVKVFFDNGAIPRYIGIPNTDGVFAKQWEDGEKVNAFRKLFKQTYTNAGSANDIAVFPALKDIKQLGVNFDEMAYPDLTNHAEAAICMAFGIPPGLVGAQVGLEHNTYANNQEQRRSFYEDTVSYWWSRVDDAFTRRLLPEFEWDTRYSLVFDTSNVPAFQDNENEAHERARGDFMAGLVSRHIAQTEAGYKPHGEDVFLIPFSVTQVPLKGWPVTTATISQPDADPEPDTADEAVRAKLRALTADPEYGQVARNMLTMLDSGGPQDENIVRQALTGLARQDMKNALLFTPVLGAKKFADPLMHNYAKILGEERLGAKKYITRHGRTYVNPYHEDELFTRSSANTVATKRRDLMAKLADILEPRVESFLRQQGSRLIAYATDLRSDGQPFETRAIEAYDWFGDDDELLDMMRQWWAEVTEQAFGVVEQELGVDYAFTVSNPYLSEITGILGHRIRGINETTRQNIERIVREKLQEGTTIPDLADALNEWLEPTYTNRANVVARTESQVALNTATEKAYAATGQVSMVRMFDNSSCHEPTGYNGLSCSDRSGMIVPLAEMGNHSGGAHPNCQLAFAAVLDPIEGF